jgi:N utilization substance protein B
MYASLISGAKLADALEGQLERRESADDTAGFARDLAEKVRAHGDELESWLHGLISDRWDPSRIGKLEVVILTIGLAEIRYSPDVPFRAVINEACELTRRFCDDGAIGFVNAVLDRAAAETYPEQKSSPGKPAAGQPKPDTKGKGPA